jgi:hypothetical protein
MTHDALNPTADALCMGFSYKKVKKCTRSLGCGVGTLSHCTRSALLHSSRSITLNAPTVDGWLDWEILVLGRREEVKLLWEPLLL